VIIATAVVINELHVLGIPHLCRSSCCICLHVLSQTICWLICNLKLNRLYKQIVLASATSLHEAFSYKWLTCETISKPEKPSFTADAVKMSMSKQTQPFHHRQRSTANDVTFQNLQYFKGKKLGIARNMLERVVMLERAQTSLFILI